MCTRYVFTRRFAAKVVQRAMKSDECLLTDVVGVFAGPEHADDRCRHGRLIPFDEQRKRAIVARAGARDQLVIGNDVVHSKGKRRSRLRSVRRIDKRGGQFIPRRMANGEWRMANREWRVAISARRERVQARPDRDSPFAIPSRAAALRLNFASMTLLRLADRGLYCEAGDFYIDPWQPVDRAVITHAHGDHARWGSRALPLLARGRARAAHAARRRRRRSRPSITAKPSTSTASASRSTPPATSSARRRSASSTAAKCGSSRATTRPSPIRTCTPFEPVRCHTFITESHLRAADLPLAPAGARCSPRFATWWRGEPRTRAARRCSSRYALGKAQRLLAGLRRRGHRPDLHARRGRATQPRLPRGGRRARRRRGTRAACRAGTTSRAA